MSNPERLYLNPVHTLEPRMTIVQVPHLNFHNEIFFTRELTPQYILSDKIENPSKFFSYTRISPTLLLAHLRYVKRRKNL